MRNHVQRLVDRYGGPAVSIALHAIVIIVLVNVVVFQALETGREVEVQVLEADESPELEQELQKLDELPPDENLLVADEPEALPDAMPDDFSVDSMDLAGLAVSAADSPLVMKGLFAGRTDAARASQAATASR